MRDDIANKVYSVIAYGLRLRERLEHGDKPDMSTEQSVLKGLIGGDSEARGLEDYGGDQAADMSRLSIIRGGEGVRRSEHFMGIRYALACWLDEMFILDCPWPGWRERCLELALFNGAERAWLFWEQARRAEAKPGTDALECYYLCVMLGFRGEYRDRPEELKTWRGTVEARLLRAQAPAPSMPPESKPASNVPPLHGQERFQKMALLFTVLLGILIPIATFLLIKRFN